MAEESSSAPLRGQDVSRLARVRLGTAAALMACGAVFAVRYQIWLFTYPCRPYRFDPAALFYLAGVVGLLCRAFWARYLVICFATAMLALRLAWWPRIDIESGLAVGVIALLSGTTMRALFEGRPSRWNPWARVLDRRIHRLRVLFVAQSVALAMLFATRAELSGLVAPVVVAAGAAVAGLVFHRTWAALLMVPVLGLEAYLGAIGVANRPDLGLAPHVTFLASAVSIAVLAPIVHAAWRGLPRL